MKQATPKYALEEIEGMIDHLDKLILDVENLSTQLKKSEELNMRLLMQNTQLAMALDSTTSLVRAGGTFH